jgi:hypothetical protein
MINQGSSPGAKGSSDVPATVVTARVVLIALLVPISLYVAPRVVALVGTPTNMDQAIAYGYRYNPRLPILIHEEQQTLGELSALDRMNAALVRVRGTDAEVASQLRILIGQVRGNVQQLLNHTNSNVSVLLRSLQVLEAQLSSLHDPVHRTRSDLAADRRRLSDIIDVARMIAATVDTARKSADAGANNIAGPSH